MVKQLELSLVKTESQHDQDVKGLLSLLFYNVVKFQ